MEDWNRDARAQIKKVLFPYGFDFNLFYVEAFIASVIWGSLGFCRCLVTILFILLLILFCRMYMYEDKGKALIAHGKRCTATVERFYDPTGDACVMCTIRLKNGKKGWVETCELYYDPRKYVEEGMTVDCYCTAKNKYYLDFRGILPAYPGASTFTKGGQ